MPIQIPYTFKNKALLDEALNHRSTMILPHNERLEFIGDRVINLIMVTALWKYYPLESESQWAKRYVNCVSRHALANMAKNVSLDKYIKSAKKTELSDKILADSFEAYLGALYLDSSFDVVQNALYDLVKSWLKQDTSHEDPKNIVQEIIQKKGYSLPRYHLINKQGPDHDPIFCVELSQNQLNIKTTGKGHTIKEAEKFAAQRFVQLLQEKKFEES